MLCKSKFRMHKHSLICDHTTFQSLISNFLTLLIESFVTRENSVFKHFRLKGQCCASMLPEYEYSVSLLISTDNPYQSTKLNLESIGRNNFPQLSGINTA